MPTCCSCGEDMGSDYEVKCPHGFSMHEDVCNEDHAGLEDPCPIGRSEVSREQA